MSSEVEEAARRICPTCGCALVRLGIPAEKARTAYHGDQAYHFCCDGCRTRFHTDPDRFVAATEDLRICPTCLGETPRSRATEMEHPVGSLFFCGCPHCEDEFGKGPRKYLDRLLGHSPYAGIFGADLCCGPAEGRI